MADRHAGENYADRDLDALLDEALASYADVEPDRSLRARILARTEGVPARRMWHIGWLVAAACSAALLLALLLYPANRATEDRAVQDHARTTTPPQPDAASAILGHTLTDSTHPHVVAAIHHPYYRTKPGSPRPHISLASAPITEEEATLLRFAQQHPEQAREVLSPPPSEPIHIDPVIIAPIQVAALSRSQSDAH